MKRGVRITEWFDADWIRLRGEALISHVTISGGASLMPNTFVIVNILTEDDEANWTLINGFYYTRGEWWMFI